MTKADTAEADPPPELRYARFNMRMLALSIDLLLIMIILQPLINHVAVSLYGQADVEQLLLAVNQPQGEDITFRQLGDLFLQSLLVPQVIFSNVAQSVALGIISVLCWHYWRATPGKLLFRMKVVDAVTLASPSWRQAILRFLGYFVSTLPLGFGFLWILWDDKRQGFHDKIAGTVVILPPQPKRTYTLTSKLLGVRKED